MKNDPLVSIIIPVYNGADYVGEAIESALAQTYENKEIIVINDGSNDEGKTEQVLLKYLNKGIKYYYKENGGVSSALNLGIQHMKGEFFSWLSHDDKYKPEKITKQIRTIKDISDENIVVACDNDYIDINSKQIKAIRKNRNLVNGKIIEWHSVMKNLLQYGAFNGCGLLIPKKIFVQYNLSFNESLRYAQDALMWYEIFLNKSSLIYINEPLVENRIHEKQQTQTGKDLFKQDSLFISKEIKELLIKNNSGKNDLIYLYLKRNAILGNKKVIKYYLKDIDIRRKITEFAVIRIRFYEVYGSIRPIIRKIYYRLFRKMKTN